MVVSHKDIVAEGTSMRQGRARFLAAMDQLWNAVTCVKTMVQLEEDEMFLGLQGVPIAMPRVVVDMGCGFRPGSSTSNTSQQQHIELNVLYQPRQNAFIPPTMSAPGPLSRVWLKWKSLKLPWRKQFLVGE